MITPLFTSLVYVCNQATYIIVLSRRHHIKPVDLKASLHTALTGPSEHFDTSRCPIFYPRWQWRRSVCPGTSGWTKKPAGPLMASLMSTGHTLGVPVLFPLPLEVLERLFILQVTSYIPACVNETQMSWEDKWSIVALTMVELWA